MVLAGVELLAADAAPLGFVAAQKIERQPPLRRPTTGCATALEFVVRIRWDRKASQGLSLFQPSPHLPFTALFDSRFQSRLRQRQSASWLMAVGAVVAFSVHGAMPLSWTGGEGGRVISLPATNGAPRVGFSSMSPQTTGVRFTNELRGDLSLTNAVAHNGSGVAIGDVDGDDWPDVYFCNLQGPNRLYRNLGDWRFQEAPPGDAACAQQLSTGAAFADVDGDGDLDLLVNGVAAGTRLFLNDGRGGLSEAKESGLSRTASATSLALADIDGDGDLDLYCTHYIDVMHLADPTTRFALAREDGKWRVTKVNGEPASRPYWRDRFEVLPDGSVRELPEVHGLYRNEGGGRFKAIQFDPGTFLSAEGNPVAPCRDWGLSVMFRDLNGDGAPDLFVANDNASPDRLWLNTGQGTFRAPGPNVFRHSSRSSMALDFADVDRDGHDDLLVLDMLARAPDRRMRQLVRDTPDPAANERADEAPRYNRNVLFFGRADGTFAEAALMAGVAATDWSWCPAFIDVDLDGYEDLLVTNGFGFDVMDQDSHDQIRTKRLTYEQQKRFRQFHPAWPTPNAAFRNRRDGTFDPAGDAWGFNRAGISYGMALGDLDNDGDLDVVVNNLNDVAGLYRNEVTAGRVAVRLKGLSPNTAGIGARLRLTGGPVAQSQEMISGGRYLSCDLAGRVFATDGGTHQPLELEVTWRNGTQTKVAVRPNTICEIVQPTTAPALARTMPVANDWFLDVSSQLGHVHVEDAFDDWTRQPLLPRRLSRLGPGLSWNDANGDGWEDLVVSAARGGLLAVYFSEGGKRFRAVKAGPTATDDLGAVLGWPDGKGNRGLLVARSNFGAVREQESAVMAFGIAGTTPASVALTGELPAGPASPGPLALADVDGDGDLDLFVGGRFLPGRYPEPVPSALWLNEAGELRRSGPLSEPFVASGLVSGAAFADLDGDGDADLALAIEWGPLRVFRNQQGRFEDMTTAWGFSGRTGWWTGVTAGDFDGDGRLDLAAGNRGRNSLYELYQPGPIRLYHVDTDGDGTVETIEAGRSAERWVPVRPRPWVARGLPDLPQRISTHEQYGKATVEEVLGTRFAEARSVEANFLESAVFLNCGGRFECVPLPREAQLAPAFSVNLGDFDGDGREDLFLSQNFFGGGSDLNREDAGRGLWLRGRGDGTFEAMETGIRIYGEQRAAALADFTHDGRVDLAVTQNNGATRLFVNQRAQRGLRVVLAGPSGNPDGVGAQLRIAYAGGQRGPARTVQAGSGYWSQDSAAQALGLAGKAEAVWIRWPDGREQSVAVENGQWELRASHDDARN